MGQYLQNLSRKRQRPWSWARPDSDDNFLTLEPQTSYIVASNWIAGSNVVSMGKTGDSFY